MMYYCNYYLWNQNISDLKYKINQDNLTPEFSTFVLKDHFNNIKKSQISKNCILVASKFAKNKILNNIV